MRAKKVTLTKKDIECVKFLLPCLIGIARDKKPIPYGKLAERARQNDCSIFDPDIGRRIRWIRCFTDWRGLPDLNSIVVSAKDGEPSKGYECDSKTEQEKRDFNKEQKKCYRRQNWHEGKIGTFLEKLKTHEGKEISAIFEAFKAKP